MKSSNPVLSGLEETAAATRRQASSPASYPQGQYAQDQYQQAQYPPPQYPSAGYGTGGQPPYVNPVDTGRTMSLDDVIVRTLYLVGLVILTAAISWTTLKSGGLVAAAMIGASLAGIVLVFVISFRRVTNPVIISLYAALQGVLLGVVSREFEKAYPGIVVQAVAGTLAVFFGMAILYKLRIVRATPRFTRWVIGALIGVVGLSLINWMLSLFGHNLGIEYYSPGTGGGKVAIIFALICIGVGALTFILDFDAVEKGVQYGMPERFAWYCAFGIVVGLIYLYWQILRLLGYLRQ